MRPIVLVVVAFAALSIAAGCSSGGPSASSTGSSSAAAASADSFCDSLCQRLTDCDSTSDVQTCTEKCNDTLSSKVEKLRADVVTEVRACWDKSDCRQVLGGERLGDCIDEAAVSAAPNAKAKSLCDSLAAGLAKCDAEIDRAECLDTVKIYSDATLDQASKCTAKSCSTMMDCVSATL